jgi:hypothetical protein
MTLGFEYGPGGIDPYIGAVKTSLLAYPIKKQMIRKMNIHRLKNNLPKACSDARARRAAMYSSKNIGVTPDCRSGNLAFLA